MRLRKYLFIGGPCDQQWRAVPPGLPIISVMESGNPSDVDTRRIVNYYRRTLRAPGWFVPLTIYTMDPVLLSVTGRGIPMPGWVEGQRPDCQPCGPFRYLDADPDDWWGIKALHNAIRARGNRAGHACNFPDEGWPGQRWTCPVCYRPWWADEVGEGMIMWRAEA